MQFPTLRLSRRPPVSSAELAPFRFTPLDVCLLMGIVAFAIGGAMPLAVHFREHSRELDRELAASLTRNRQLEATLGHLQARRSNYASLRQAARHYESAIEARTSVPWMTIVRELSEKRPGGVAAVRLAGSGSRFDVEVQASRADLVPLYVDRLRQSPHVDFAALPPGAPAGSRARITGRIAGE